MTEIRPLIRRLTIEDTIERVLPTARSSAELQRWCTELAVSVRSAEADRDHLVKENRSLVDTNLELEIMVGGYTRDDHRRLREQYQAAEQGRIDLAFAIELHRQIEKRVIAAYRAAGVLGDVPDPTTTELIVMMGAAPDTAEESARLDRERDHMDELNRRMRWAEGRGDA